MRVYLTTPELATDVGKQLLELAVRVATDGTLELGEFKELFRWLRANRESSSVTAVRYLQDIMTRITLDGVVDRDELLELHTAIERVIPALHRAPVVQARKKREAARLDRHREQRRIEKERENAERKRTQEAEYARHMRLRHTFAKVAGVTFPNDDGSERQAIIERCSPREQLILRHDADNACSAFAIDVLRTNGEQLGHAPEYLAERICNELEDGYRVVGILANVTGGTWDKPTRGVNFAAFFLGADVTNEEFKRYAETVLESDGR
jgi:hypothetical protein